jgi:hypothetical protein
VKRAQDLRADDLGLEGVDAERTSAAYLCTRREANAPTVGRKVLTSGGLVA